MVMLTDRRRLLLVTSERHGALAHFITSVDVAVEQPSDCDPAYVYVRDNRGERPVLRSMLFKIEQAADLIAWVDRMCDFERATRIESDNLKAQLVLMNEKK